MRKRTCHLHGKVRYVAMHWVEIDLEASEWCNEGMTELGCYMIEPPPEGTYVDVKVTWEVDAPCPA